MRLHSPACDRNKRPILDALKPHLASSAGKVHSVLEIAAGSGQHCAYLARNLEPWVASWYPTDLGMTDEKKASIASWVEEEGAGDVVRLPAGELDTRSPAWELR